MSNPATEKAVKVIKLARPVRLHDKTYAEVKLREPTGGLYAKLGEPRLMIYNPTGSGYYIEQNDVINAYLEKLIDFEFGGEVMFCLLSLEDAKMVREGLFDFFEKAGANVLARLSTSSSSASA